MLSPRTNAVPWYCRAALALNTGAQSHSRRRGRAAAPRRPGPVAEAAGFAAEALERRVMLAAGPVLVSANQAGTGSGNGPSGALFGTNYHSTATSANGRVVVFASAASDLAPNDNNNTIDLFARDLATGVTALVSANVDGTGSGNQPSPLFSDVSISADGRYVAFMSPAGNLVTNDTNNNLDVFVRDLEAGVTTLVSVNAAGTASGNGASLDPVISADGRAVAFKSSASDLIAGVDANGARDVFVRDLAAGTTTLVSVNGAGTDAGNAESGGNGANIPLAISADGRTVAFVSAASDLIANETTGNAYGVFVRDLSAGTTVLASVNHAGTGSGDAGAGYSNFTRTLSLSADGRTVAFESASTDLLADDGFDFSIANIFVRDLAAGTTRLASVHAFGPPGMGGPSFNPVLSGDGRYVVFYSWSSFLVAGDTNGTADLFVRDLVAETTSLVSMNAAGTGPGNNFTGSHFAFSADGRTVAFTSDADDLVTAPADTNHTSDVFVRNLATGVTVLASSNHAGTASGDRPSGQFGLSISLSADGRTVAFESAANDLVPNDTNFGQSDIFALYAPQAAPTADAGGPYTVAEGGTVTLSGSGSGGDALSYAWDLDYDGVTFDADAFGPTVNFTDAGLENTPPRTVALRVTDGGGLSGIDTAVVTVTPVNDAPAALPASFPVTEDTPRSIDLSPFAGDAETADADLVYNVSLPAGFPGTFTPVAGQNGLFTFAPAAGFTGTASLTFTVTDRGDPDGVGASPPLTSAAATVTLNVLSGNDAPVNLVPATAPATNEDRDRKVSLGVADPDAGAEPLRVTIGTAHGTLTLGTVAGLTFAVGDGTADASMTFEGTLSALNAALGGLTFTPAPNFNGSAQIVITTDDLGNTGAGGARSDTDTVVVAVAAVNDRPVAGNQAVLASEGAPQTIDLRLAAFDVETADSDLVYTVKLPSKFRGTLVPVVGQNGLFTFTPDPGFTGTTSLTYSVTDRGDPDGTGTSPPRMSGKATITITVQPVNVAPVTAAPGPQATAISAPPVFAGAKARRILVEDFDLLDGNPR